MNRPLWAVALAALCAFLWFRIDWLLTLPEPWLSFASVLALLLLLLSAAGALLPSECAGVVQVVIGFIGLLALWGGALTSL